MLNLLTLRKNAGVFLLVFLVALHPGFDVQSQEKTINTGNRQTVTLLFTNDLESTYDPVSAFWRDDMERIGGIAQLATLIDGLRESEANVFLFDAGDIFTGILAKLTQGEVSFELMNTMAYDAMAIGNHEFEYGWEVLEKQKHRVPFPVLGANLFYKGTDIHFAQPYSIIERNGIRIGVIGILGQDAATALNPPNIAGLDVRDPKVIVPEYVKLLRPDVDLIVLLTHQGKTAPMQTDDSAHPEIQRDINAEIELAGVVDGIDVIFSGHADAGTEKPVVHPETGTLIMQTYGQGFHLGYLQLQVDIDKDEVLAYDGRLIPVDSDSLKPHAGVAEKLARYREHHKEIYAVVGHSAERLSREYNAESDLGNLFADIHREEGKAQIGLYPSGGIRRDIDAGPVTVEELLDAWPFLDDVVTVRLKGGTLLQVLEQGLSLERGIMQVSGIVASYDLKRPIGSRVLSVKVDGKALEKEAYYTVATGSFITNGGDLYTQFLGSELVYTGRDFATVLTDYFKSRDVVSVPARGRLIPD
ncbi:MAG: 5'-nucleotidase/UDP-sugar diphosphatase [Gammaproteobacteria bacterium]|jgi:5'-nucleotidase/UDP-sugar diphosphatase